MKVVPVRRSSSVPAVRSTSPTIALARSTKSDVEPRPQRPTLKEALLLQLLLLLLPRRKTPRRISFRLHPSTFPSPSLRERIPLTCLTTWPTLNTSSGVSSILPTIGSCLIKTKSTWSMHFGKIRKTTIYSPGIF